MSKEKTRKYKINGPTMAEQADRHALYEEAVQCVDVEIDFIEQSFQRLRGRPAASLREEFCGTANAAYEWIRRRGENTAYCIDLDPAVLEWSRHHHLNILTQDQARRIHLINGDVFTAVTPAVDVVTAMNFSYWYLKSRAAMRKYFQKVHGNLVADGILFLDAFGGYEAFRVLRESTRYNGFTYIWDQASYNPVTGDALLHIHFKFRDGSMINNAFTYEWRIWTLPELTELLEESGFRATVYWEEEDEDGDGTGIYYPVTAAPADAGWLAYIVAEKR